MRRPARTVVRIAPASCRIVVRRIYPTPTPENHTEYFI
ncbi:hypothetical protein B005_3124 [Nocardiopsis alba ATCC BAA-2165]|uniref:Uncharacterized protein n=1 Tax=Nocardiopsis alba (strain ATCC BAA-2165 / BE74) TaxID=1205910 RepID=J7LDW1_NOCAA|nr:hypothetical protein B005_3124 [Nocardiopsis alba ATCC BAA-2165]